MDHVGWGIIGCGDVAEYKSGPALANTPGSRLAAVMRRDRGAARDFAVRHGALRWYDSAADLIADPQVNAIYIAAPHAAHLENVRLAAQGRKAILCEKPMGANRGEAQAIVDTCHAARAPLCVAYYRRFWPVTQKVKALLADGAVGEPVQARIQLCDYFNGDPKRAWITAASEAGGGALANAGSHWVDLARYLLGEIVEVMAVCTYESGFKVEDSASLVMRTRHGATITLSSTWRGRASVNEVDVIGTGGRLIASNLNAGQLQLIRSGKELQTFDLRRDQPAHAELVEAFVRSILSGGASPVPGEEAVADWRVIEAAYQSSREGIKRQVVP